MKTFKGALSLLVIGFFLFLECRRKSDGADDSEKADSERVMVRRFDEIMQIKKEQLFIRIALYRKAATYSPTTSVVPSALKGLTALFGMVRGETFDYNHLKFFRCQELGFRVIPDCL